MNKIIRNKISFNFSCGPSFSTIEKEINDFCLKELVKINKISLEIKNCVQNREGVYLDIEIDIDYNNVDDSPSKICVDYFYLGSTFLKEYCNISQNKRIEKSELKILELNNSEKQRRINYFDDLTNKEIKLKAKEKEDNFILKSHTNFNVKNNIDIEEEENDYFLKEKSDRFINLDIYIFIKDENDRKLNINELKKIKWTYAVIVFKPESFTEDYSLEERSYLIYNNGNDIADLEMNSMDGSDKQESLKKVINSNRNPWDVDYCYTIG